MKERWTFIFSKLNKQSRRKQLQKVISVFATISVFITCYALIIPAITLTMENADVYCGFEMHIHSDDCYDSCGNVICGVVEHEHDMLCYTQEVNSSVYCCGFEYEHEHSDSCYDGDSIVCELEEHKHGDECVLKMPSQDFNVETEKFTVTVSASNGCLPESSVLHVSEAIPAGTFEGFENCELFGLQMYFSDQSGEKVVPKRPLSIKFICGTLLYESRRSVIKVDNCGEHTEINCANVSTDGVSFVDTVVADYVIACRKLDEDELKTNVLESSVNDTTIKIEYTSLAEIPDGTELVVDEFDKHSRQYKDFLEQSIDAIDADNALAARVFDISLVNDGKEIEPKAPVNVSVSSDKSFVSEGEKLKIVHFVDDKEPEILKVANISNDATELIYKQSSFSAVVMTTVADNFSGTFSGNNEYTTVSKSILNNDSVISNFDDANEWQVVSGKYQGNTVSQKIDVQDHIRGQKNLIPTGVENEFLVYLSLDINFENILTEYLIGEDTGMVLQTNNSSNTKVHPNWVNQQAAAEEAWNGTSTTARPLYAVQQGDYTKPWTIVFNWKYDDKDTSELNKTFSVVRYTDNDTFNKGFLDLRLGPVDEATASKAKLSAADNIGWYHVGSAAKADASSPLIVNLESSMVSKVLDALNNVKIGTMTDSMGNTVGGQAFGTGEGIIATEIVSSSIMGESVTGNASISEDGKSISWTPEVSSLKISDASSGWFNNVAELVYKIKYVPPKGSGLTSGTTTLLNPTDAQVQTNANTEIAYTTTSTSSGQTEGKLNLTSPVIRSLLYEIKANKVDQDNKPLSGATFEIYTKDGGTTNVVSTVVSDANGVVDFQNLPAGTYYFKETSAPNGYVKDETEYGPYVLSYTTSSSNPSYTSSTSAPLIGQGTLEEALMNPASPIIVINVARPAFDLPETGGIGTYVFYISGVMLIMLSSFVYIVLYRKRRTTLNK